MKLHTIKHICLFSTMWFLFAYTYDALASNLRVTTLKDTLQNMVFSEPFKEIKINTEKSKLGEKFFEEELLSFNGKISCSSCHIDQFGSSDGLRNSIGVGGHGEGKIRLKSDGLVVPRNSMALWGRGEIDFSVFFWDGKVEKTSEGTIISQFGDLAPSNNPLITAIHLPFVEIREMVNDDDLVNREYKDETVNSANAIYEELLTRIKNKDDYRTDLMEVYGIEEDEIKFLHIADAISIFIKDKFRLRKTRLEQYADNEVNLNKKEIEGGLLFIGKGKCLSCHSGRHLTDFKFHSIPFPQSGFGKNGFGVDYGRFNVTHDPDDLYKFRTPPLTNVSNTAPYGHSGSVDTVEQAIIAHFDPLRLHNVDSLTALERNELYKKIVASKDDFHQIPFLNDDEVKKITIFLRTLDYE